MRAATVLAGALWTSRKFITLNVLSSTKVISTIVADEAHFNSPSQYERTFRNLEELGCFIFTVPVSFHTLFRFSCDPFFVIIFESPSDFVSANCKCYVSVQSEFGLLKHFGTGS